MCAAPGSKTFQLLEALHTITDGDADAPATTTTASSSSTGPQLSDLTPSGLVVANDADMARCSLLTHQVKRVCSPCLMVINHSAELLPVLRDARGAALRFDRVLCDVPCSGDGTMRKAPDIWRKWSVGNGIGLHIIQLRIALQGIKLMEVRLVEGGMVRERKGRACAAGDQAHGGALDGRGTGGETQWTSATGR